jgi:flagellar biogenesis protein FliO
MRERRVRRVLLALVLILGSTAPVVRAQGTLPTPASDAPDDSPSTGAFKVVVALLVTLASILLFATLLKRVPLAGGQAGDLTLESRLAVTRGGQVAVVRVDERRILLGITASQVNLIAELDEKAKATPVDRNTFERLVSGMLRRGGKA